MLIWCSIDPGQSGAMIIWHDSTPYCVVPAQYDEDKMPNQYMINLFKEEKIRTVVIEKVGGIPGQGASGSFNFGLGCGCYFGACKALGIKIVTFTPNYWMRVAHKGMLKSLNTKERSRLYVEQKMPSILDIYPKNDGVWDAVSMGLVAWEGGFIQ